MATKLLDEKQSQILRRRYYNGESVKKLADIFGLSVPTIYNYLKGSPNRPHRRLTPTQVVEILSEPPEKSIRVLAKIYGVSYETIRRVRKGGQ